MIAPTTTTDMARPVLRVAFTPNYSRDEAATRRRRFGSRIAEESRCARERLTVPPREAQPLTGMNRYPSAQRCTRAVDGLGKWVTHMIVGSSQKRSKIVRLVVPAWMES
jgi:hypothetical protein